MCAYACAHMHAHICMHTYAHTIQIHMHYNTKQNQKAPESRLTAIPYRVTLPASQAFSAAGSSSPSWDSPSVTTTSSLAASGLPPRD